LDYSKEAWVNGKKGMYIMPDGSVDQIDIEPLTHMEAEYGIFVSDAGKDIEKKQKLFNQKVNDLKRLFITLSYDQLREIEFETPLSLTTPQELQTEETEHE
jgi:hypothetical protein